MTHFDDELTRQLGDANPVRNPELNELERRRSEKHLQAILGDARAGLGSRAGSGSGAGRSNSGRWLLGAAAAVSAIALGTGLLPSLFNGQESTATAEEILATAGESSLHAADATDIAITAQEYLERTDRLGEEFVSTAYEVSADGQVRTSTAQSNNAPAELQDANRNLSVDPVQLQATGADTESLRALADSLDDSTARGVLKLLLHPALSSEQQKALYELMASLDGNDLAGVEQSTTGGDDEVVTVIRDVDQLSFSVIPATGQLVRVHGLVGPGITTEVSATAIVDCVHVTGLEGPEMISTACADNNYYVEDLEWENWGADTATATGTAWINNCDPLCADGEFATFPVRLTLDNREECGYNARIYSRMLLEYPENPDRNEEFSIGCAQPTEPAH
ncbi:hypothetical protein [Corynebacterium pseudodiphtheriticum]|uniref:hypothetical protein n=1 Tax=Corynebacterium pseudodiphtheriticum TaxID=37637 RepID=UPI0020C16023|nr:hypothetical protein [Corynebacterium pseudodiphtheriticum]MDK8478562.1 hypothetical protein [Corynebacterium pseudodiphtheriticum]MDK8487168.1 hypothetical protein [Corynebacterium pseudodiphtheriticum]MDK8494463.1 hypothetical protein [Corynebacterium pseudodiphtheriticum]UQV54191.1 hypothetical protein L2D23_00180 [Corynebacterium pseudodiphtheriticum]